MKTFFTLFIVTVIALPALAQQPGFYTAGVSASTEKGARKLMQELLTNEDEPDVCYSGDYQSALDSTDDFISIAIIDVYGESEFPPLDAEITDKDGSSVSAIIHSCD